MKDARKLASAELKPTVEQLLRLLAEDRVRNARSFETLVIDRSGAYSPCINNQHRLVYEVITKKRDVRVFCMWAHHE